MVFVERGSGTRYRVRAFGGLGIGSLGSAFWWSLCLGGISGRRCEEFGVRGFWVVGFFFSE